MSRVLIIDDDDSFREVMLFHLEEDGIEADAAADGQAGLAAFDPDVHAVVVTDLKMPGLDGMEVLRQIRERAPATVVVVISAFGTIEKAVEALKGGAFDFIPKPCSRDHFKVVVNKALEHHRLENRVHELEFVVQSGGRELLFRSAKMRDVVELADKVARTNATALISGESGTGKELIARRLHQKSARRASGFVAVNCGAIPKDLMESELFGHVKGAFTGAARDRKGKFELADGGTLFLDEVGEIPLELQAKLLRALAENVIDVVGREQPAPVDVRVIAASNKDLAEEVAGGRFRGDLFYRLNVIQIALPPLRERGDDVVLLAEAFLRRFAPGRALHLDAATQGLMTAYAWPGNVRELENVIQRVAVLAEDDQIGPDLLPAALREPAAEPEIASPGHGITLPKEGVSLVDLERDVIVRALEMNDFNQAQTARFLRIPRHVLLYRIEKYEIATSRRGAAD